MNINFPNREPVVVQDHELRVVRRLPGTGDVKIRAGERISADHVLARTDPKSTAVKISLADQLGVPPADLPKFLMKPVGSSFGAGEALARNRKGLRNVVVASPLAGTLVSIDAESGMALIAPGNGGELKSLVGGDVEFVDGKQSVSIRTVGTRVFGIVAIGNSATGEIRVISTGPSEELQASKITNDLAGKIVVGGSFASAAVIKKLVEVGAAGIITGGFVDKEVLASLGAPSDDRLAPWRLKAGDHVIADEYNPGIALMATEGFGALPINPEIYAMLRACAGLNGVLFTPTRVVGYLARPQLIVVNEELLDEDAPSGSASLKPGSKARLVDQFALGQTVEIASGLKRARRGDGITIDVVDVMIANGQTRTVPLVNVELIA